MDIAIANPAQTECSVNNGVDNSLYSNNTHFVVWDWKTQLKIETQEIIVPSKPVIGNDDHLTDIDKLCGVFLRKLKEKPLSKYPCIRPGCPWNEKQLMLGFWFNTENDMESIMSIAVLFLVTFIFIHCTKSEAYHLQFDLLGNKENVRKF